MLVGVPHSGVHHADEAAPAARLQRIAVLEKNVRIWRPLAIGAGRDVRQIGEEGRGTVNLVEDSVGKRRHAGNIQRIPVCLELAIGWVDIGIRVDRSDGAVERPLDEAAPNPVVGVALPRKEDVMRHSGAGTREGL